MSYINKPYKVKNKLVRNLEINNETGFLDLSVFSAIDQSPIESAEVTVYLYEIRGIYQESAVENKIISYTTDSNGKIPTVELPVIHELGEVNLSEYHVRVDKPGYYSTAVINIEIFPNTTTAFNVVLNPVTTGESRTEFIIIPEKHWFKLGY